MAVAHSYCYELLPPSYYLGLWVDEHDPHLVHCYQKHFRELGFSGLLRRVGDVPVVIVTHNLSQ